MDWDPVVWRATPINCNFGWNGKEDAEPDFGLAKPPETAGHVDSD
jgi:hypothetical protein